MLVKRCVILAKEEVTYGVDPVPTPADNAIRVINPVINPTGEKLTRDHVKTSLSPLSPLMGKKYVEITFTTELRSNGLTQNGDTAPRVGDLFEACAMLETLTPESSGGGNDGSVKYTPTSDNLKSVTIYAYFDGLLHKITACVGTWEIIMEAGQIAKVNWTFKGFYQAPTDTALPSGVVYDSSVPPVVLNAGFKINNVSTLVTQSVAAALNNVISQRDDVNAASGIKGFLITDRAGGGSFNPEAVLKATYDFYDDWKEATARALEITIGSVAGNKIKISAPKVTLDNITPGDREGIRVFDIPFSLAESSGDDEISVTFK